MLLRDIDEGAESFQIKKLLTTENGELTLAKRFMSGSVAGALSQSAIYPIEVRPAPCVL